jgi:hypothetical protein
MSEDGGLKGDWPFVLQPPANVFWALREGPDGTLTAYPASNFREYADSQRRHRQRAFAVIYRDRVINAAIVDGEAAWLETLGPGETVKASISTVFLGVVVPGPGFDPERPYLFETGVFDGEFKVLDMVRYRTAADADIGHAALLAKWQALLG